MKSKAWIYYLALNIALVALVGFLAYRTYFPSKPKFPEGQVLFEETFVFGEGLKIMDPDVVDNSETECTFPITLENDTAAAKTFYLFLQVEGDKEVIDILTVKLQDKGLLLSYVPNYAIKTITLQAGESLTLNLKIYLDFLQILDAEVFAEKQVVVSVYDDYARFYALLDN